MAQQSRQAHHYLPAMGRDSLLPLYDPLTLLLGAGRLHRTLITDSAIEPGHAVLEIGCGTGNLTLQLARRHPDVHVTGLDPDPRALARARTKARRAGAEVRWDEGTATQLPYPDESMDRVLSSLMLHHLSEQEKPLALAEARRVLRPGGRLHIVDFGGHPHGLAGLLSRHHRLQANTGNAIPTLLSAAGFRDIVQLAHRSRLGVVYYRAVR